MEQEGGGRGWAGTAVPSPSAYSFGPYSGNGYWPNLAFSPPHFVFPRLPFCVFSGLLLEQTGWWEEESDLDISCHLFTY